MLDTSRIRAVSIDLDDTLWPIWPTIERAELALQDWLHEHAPNTAKLVASIETRQAIRVRLEQDRPDLRHDFSALRRESIRIALTRAEEDPALAEAAFDVFFEARQRVDLFDDALATLDHLSRRFPLVALSNGNADVQRVGIGKFFHASVASRDCGFAKPDARIFEVAAKAAGVACADMLHIGDDPALDVLGALDAGMQAAWLNRERKPWTHARQPGADVVDLLELCRQLEPAPHRPVGGETQRQGTGRSPSRI